jgi:DNA-binding winged helix-turn-helix (wHTH) protein/TolB-like protein
MLEFCGITCTHPSAAGLATMPSVQRFDRFEFDPSSGELRDGGAVVRLEPQPAKVLALLAARSGEVVTRDELRLEVWPADVFVDFERGLNYCIRRVRQALGDSPEAPRFIATLPKRGYRFLVPVQEASSSHEGRSAAGAPARRRPLTRAAALPAAAGLAAAAILAVALTIRERPPARQPAPPPHPTVAVTLFDNETGRPDLDRAAQVFTDVVVERLARGGPPWSVIGNAAILRKPRPLQNLAEIGVSLQAELAVLGQILPADRGLIVLTHLVRTGDQRHVWVGRFTVAPAPLPADADRVSAAAATAVARYAARANRRP